jgi:hypothetical protein
VPFKPRIIRFDDEHAAVPTPVGAGSGGMGSDVALDPSLAAVVDTRPGEIETPPHDPTHDTICGEEFDTVANWDVNWDADDALLDDAMLQCMARQLRDDAARLAKRYPAEGWVPPAPGDSVETTPPVAVGRRSVWRRVAAVASAVAACLLITLGPRSIGDGETYDRLRPGPADVSIAEPLAAMQPASHLEYEDGDAAVWGSNPIDDSQFGNVLFGGIQTIDGEATHGDSFGVLSSPTHEALRDLLPSDSHEHCDVSM